MKKLLKIGGLFLVLFAIIWAAGEVNYEQGNIAAIEAEFKVFYIDSVTQKAAAGTRTIEVPSNKIGYNLIVWLADPDIREESLKTAVVINSVHGAENPDDTVHKYLGITDFGLNNKADSVKFYGSFSSFTVTTSTNTAGADAADSVMHILYKFSLKR